MIDFEMLKEYCIEHLNGGNGIIKSKMYMDSAIKIMVTTIDVGCSIGLHEHKTSSEIIYVLSGKAQCTLNGNIEIVESGQCHYCPQGSAHSIENIGSQPLIVFDIVPNL